MMTDDNMLQTWIQKTKDEARIFIIVGQTDCHLNLIDAMVAEKLFDNNDNNDEYFVIGVNTDTLNNTDPENHLKGVLSNPDEPPNQSVMKGMKHYLCIMTSP